MKFRLSLLPPWRATRDAILFFTGLWGVIHETLSSGDRQWLLGVFVAMMGLPAVLRQDERKDK